MPVGEVAGRNALLAEVLPSAGAPSLGAEGVWLKRINGPT